jgi:hypothetical protein
MYIEVFWQCKLYHCLDILYKFSLTFTVNMMLYTLSQYCIQQLEWSLWWSKICDPVIKKHIYRVSQEECSRFWEGVPYVQIYRYNPKHVCPKLNGYGDNGQRKVWSSAGSTHCTCQLTRLSAWPWLRQAVAISFISALSIPPGVHSPMLTQHVMYSAWNSKDSYEPVFEFFVVQFNGVTSLTS